MKIHKLSLDFKPGWEEFYEKIRLETSPKTEKEALDFFEMAKEQITPRAIYALAFIDSRSTSEGETRINIDENKFSGKTLHKLDEINRVFPYIATAGDGLKKTKVEKAHPLASHWSYILQYQAITSMKEALTDHIRKEFHTGNLNSINPGSGDTDNWPLEQNSNLFKLLDGGKGSGVTLQPSFLMKPDYSVSGFFFESELYYINCQYCSREECPGRKAEKLSAEVL